MATEAASADGGVGIDGQAPAGAAWGFEPGHVLGGGRRVVRRLALGRKTEVYLAWDERRRAPVVVKLLRPDRVVAKLPKLEREAELLERLSHPALVRRFDEMLEADPPHLVLEHVEGPSLRELLRRGPLPTGLVASVAVQVAGVLHYLAGEGLVHLDVKPQNVLLPPLAPGDPLAAREPVPARPGHAEGRIPFAVKLIDIAAVRSIGERAHGLGGDVPERRRGAKTLGAPAGVWLLGATMWRALTGGPETYPGGNAPAATSGRLGRFARRAPSPFPRGVPPAMLELTSACLAADPADRPSAEEVALAAEALIGERRPRSRMATRLGWA